MGNPPPKWIAALGSDVAANNEYSKYPNHRQYVTFFLGWLFFLALIFSLTSPTLSSIVLRLKRAFNPPNIETRSIDARAEKSIPTTASSNMRDALALDFLITLLILTTSATQFASLLAFDSSNGETSCVFLTAWNGLGVQAVRIVGFLKLGLHLNELGARRWETWILWSLLLFSTVLMFLTNAVSTGTLQQIPNMEALSFCNRRHYVLSAGLTSAMNFFIELYIIVRLVTLQLPFFRIRRDPKVFADLRLLRALSLLLLDLLTVYPSIHFINIAADYIPSALGMIPVLLAFNHQLPRGYSPSFFSVWSTKSTTVSQPPSSNGLSARSLDHILPIHTPPSAFEIQSSEYAVHKDGSSASAYHRFQTHPFGATARGNQSGLSGYPYPLQLRRGATDVALSGSPVVNRQSPFAVSVVDSRSPVVDTSSILGPSSNTDTVSSVKTSTSTRPSLFPALSTMPRGTDVETPLNVDSAESPLAVTAKGPTPASAPRNRQILPNQAEVGAQLPGRELPGSTPLVMPFGSLGRGPSTSSAATLPVPPGPQWQTRFALSGKPISPVIEEDDISKDPRHGAPAGPSPPISVVYGSDILAPSADMVDMMKRNYSISTRSNHFSHATTGRRTSPSSWVGAWSTRFSATDSMALNYPFLVPPHSPGNGEMTSSSGAGSGSRRPSTSDDASKKSEGGEKRPNTFGRESFLDLKSLFPGGRASSTKTKSSSRSSHSTDALSRPHSETDEGPGTRTSKREKGKGSRKARRTRAAAAEVSNIEQPRRSRESPPPTDPSPPLKTAPEEAAP